MGRELPLAIGCTRGTMEVTGMGAPCSLMLELKSDG